MERIIKNNYANPATIPNSKKLAIIKIFILKNFWLTLLVMKLLIKKIASILFLFIFFLKNNNIKYNIVITSYRYEINGIFFLSQKSTLSLIRKTIKFSMLPSLYIIKRRYYLCLSGKRLPILKLIILI